MISHRDKDGFDLTNMGRIKLVQKRHESTNLLKCSRAVHKENMISHRDEDGFEMSKTETLLHINYRLVKLYSTTII